MNILNDNITFLLEDKFYEKDNEIEIKQLMDKLEEEDKLEGDHIFSEQYFYNNDELYYNKKYTVKELLRICSYYDIEKNIISSKCKKQDIVSTLVYFESCPENIELVLKRNKMWNYMDELFNDQKMKKYIIWK